jgi:hypothetical protein
MEQATKHWNRVLTTSPGYLRGHGRHELSINIDPRFSRSPFLRVCDFCLSNCRVHLKRKNV